MKALKFISSLVICILLGAAVIILVLLLLDEFTRRGAFNFTGDAFVYYGLVIVSLLVINFCLLRILKYWMIWLPLYTLISLIGGLAIYLMMNPHPHSTSVYRNGRRLVRISYLQSSLEMYFNDHQKYPATLQELVPGYGELTAFPVFNIKKPKCPPSEPYRYELLDNGASYKIDFCIPEDEKNLKGGYYTVTPSNSPFSLRQLK